MNYGIFVNSKKNIVNVYPKLRCQKSIFKRVSGIFIIFLTICKRLPNLNYRLSLASCWEEQVGVGAMVGQWAQQ